MVSVVGALNAALLAALDQDPTVVLMGEDILDPYGGAFKVTRGLSSRHPQRVLTTPVSEAGIVGMAGGMALRGLKPVVELMFGDFLTLAADQLINYVTKYRWMYNDRVQVPLVVRTPVGGYRGYGPTHSQSLEKHFLGVPGLRVVAPTTLCDPGQLLRQAVLDDPGPVLFIEHKLLYAAEVQNAVDGRIGDFWVTQHGADYPTLTLSLVGFERADVTIACYAHQAQIAQQVAIRALLEDELSVELVVFTQLAPLGLEPLLDSLARSRRLLTLEEGGLSWGWGAEVTALVAAGDRDVRLARVGARDLPIPASTALELEVLPTQARVLEALLALVGGD